jgi:hypothetical protein
MSVETGKQNIIILLLEITVSFLGNINGNQTFILDSHRLFICSVSYVTYGSTIFTVIRMI